EISPAAVATTLKKLEHAGLVERRTNAEDARFNRIDLTDKGREIVSKTKILFRQIDEEMFKDLTQEEMQNLSATLAKLVQALKKNTPSCCAGEEEGK
ncbi:MAG: MarR family transcriptional regulator, partial [Clostridia bacterium]|nr:MarR family transcriptional regulator [Clostridia bacterium]